jgi:hypothetical protein
MSTPSSIARLVTTVALLAGAAAALFYAQHDLTLSHYDARGHLIVARRLIDSLTPGWQQFGGVWLPLPHLLNSLPAQWDWSYRTGFSGAALSVLPLATALGAFAGYLARVTGSWAIAVATPFMILLNPNVLYLQSTPMTEPLLFALSLMAVVTIDRWLVDDGAGAMWQAGGALAALALTRYEGWFIGAALVALAFVAAPRRAMRLALIPAAAIVAFLFLSWGSTGMWFVASGFFEANNPALGQPWIAWDQVVEGATGLGGRGRLLLGFVGAGCCVVSAVYALARGGWNNRTGAARALLPLTLAAAVVLPLYAFTNGHPVRVRYMISLVVAAAALSACALMRLPRRLHTPAAVLMLAAAVWSTPPLDMNALMVREAQRELPESDARRQVTAALVQRWDRTPIMASMGSLGHYMQQMSAHGFALKDFLHEGNGNLWQSALVTPRPYVKWILIEETAEGGDQLAMTARANPSFLEGFARVAEGGGVALYARANPPSSTRAGSHARRGAPAARTP